VKKLCVTLVGLIMLMFGCSHLDKCNVRFTTSEYNYLEGEEICICILPEVSDNVEEFTVTVASVSDDRKWLRFTLDSEGIDSVFGFMRAKGGIWVLVDYGSAIEDEDMDRYFIPPEVRPGFIRSF